MTDRLGDQRLLRREVPIEGAVREAGLLHDLRHGHVVETAQAEEARGRRQNPRPMRGDLILADFHAPWASWPLDKIHDHDNECNHDDYHQ